MPKFKSRIKKKKCHYCESGTAPYYRDVEELSRHISERKRILPSIYTGVCAKHQRRLADSIKHARHLALLPFVAGL